jgi:hypothetical protein
LVVGLIVGGVGAATWSDLDRKTFESNGAEVADWKTALPEPVGWTESEYAQNGEYVRDHYRAADEDERTQSPILIEPAAGDAATATVLERVQALHETAPDRDVVYSRGGTAPLTSPVTVMQSVAAADESFAAVLQDADTDGDGVPERNVERVYDALFEAAPDKASRVIDRTDDGYRSVLVSVPVAPGADYGDRGEQMQALADDVATDDTVVTATGTGPVNAVQLDVISNALVQTMLVGLTGVAVLLTLVYRLTAGSATLGLVTAVPIVLVTALVVGGMWLLDVPLTANTALLLSLVIGLGIDYNVHVSDRFEQELARGHSVHSALIEATTGTGGALLGSTLTTVASFSALLIAPFAFFQNFGVLCVGHLVPRRCVRPAEPAHPLGTVRPDHDRRHHAGGAERRLTHPVHSKENAVHSRGWSRNPRTRSSPSAADASGGSRTSIRPSTACPSVCPTCWWCAVGSNANAPNPAAMSIRPEQ